MAPNTKSFFFLAEVLHILYNDCQIRLTTGPLTFFQRRIFVFARGVFIVYDKKLFVFQVIGSRVKCQGQIIKFWLYGL